MAKDYKKMLQQAGFGPQDSTEQDEQKKKSGAKDYAEMLRKAGFGANGSVQKDDGLDDAQRAARERMIALRKYENDQRNDTNGDGLNKNGLDKAQQAARDRMVLARQPAVQQQLKEHADKLRAGMEFKQTDEYKTGLQNRMSGASLSRSLAQNVPVVAPIKADETPVSNTAHTTEAREVYKEKQETPYLPGLRENSVAKQIGYLAEIAAAAVNLGAEDLKGGVEDLFNQIMAGISKGTETKQVGKVSLPSGIKKSTKPTFRTYSENQELGLDDGSSLIKSMLKASEDAWYLNSDTEETPAEKRIAEIESKYKYTNKSGVTNFLASALYGTGYSAQNIVGSLVSGGGLGNPISASMTLFKGIRRNMRDAKRMGYSKDDAVSYATQQTLADTGLDAILNAVGAGVEQVAGKAISNIPSVYARAAARTGVSALSEAAQSALSNIVSVANQKMTGNPDATIDWNSVARSAAVGGFSGTLQQGIIEIANLPTNERLAQRDYAVAEEYIKRATHVESAAEAEQMIQVGKKILEYVDDLANEETSESKARAKGWKAYKDTISAVVDDLESYGDRIVVDFTDKSDIVNNLINAPKADIVDGTADLVNKVAESIEPSENAVNATIDYIRDEIQKKQNEITMQTDPVLRRETEIDRLAIIEIEKTLRNKRAEIESARKKKLEEATAAEKQAEAKGKTTPKDRSETKREVSAPIPPVYHEGKGVVQYFVPGRKTPVATSTQSDLNVLELFGGNTTIKQAYDTPLMSANNVKNILDAYISRGYGDVTLHDMFGFTGKNEFEANQNMPVPRNGSTENDNASTVEKTPETNVQTETEKPLTETASDVTIAQEEAVNPEEQSVQPEDTTKNAPTTKEFSLTHVVKKHTKTGEDMDVFQIPKSLSDREYSDLKRKMRDVGGHYSSFVRGFIVPHDKAGSVSDFADVVEAAPAPKKAVETSKEPETVAPPETLSTPENEKVTLSTPESTPENEKVTKATEVTEATENNAPVEQVAETKPESVSPDTKNKAPSSEISNYVLNQLSEGKKFTSQELQEAANKAYGGTMAEGKYDVKAMTDAMELGVNRYIIDTVSNEQSDFNAPEAKKAVESIDEITSDILSMIPTQTKRSEEQISLQQFSTPPNIAYLASWVANIDKSDTVLEPSAGIGGLASFAKADGAKVYVNELSESRLDMLKQLPFDGFFKENAEQIHNILPDSVSPSVVLMNPPFSSTGGRTKNSTKNAIPHIEQALLRLQDGGRLVAIVGKGMADDTPTFRNWYNELRNTYDIRTNVGINGENYRKYGTTFDVQLLVIDKTGPQKGKTITGNYDDLRDIPQLLEEVRNDRNRKDQQLGTGADNKTDNGAVVNETRSGTYISDRLSERISGTNSDVGSRKPGRSNGVSKPVSDSEQSSGTDIDTTKQAGDLRSNDLRNAGGLENEHGVRNDSIETGKDTDGKELDERVQGGSPKLEEVREETTRREPVEAKHSRNVGTDGQSDGNTLLNQKEKQSSKKAAKKDNGIFAGYTPAKLTVKNAKSHPADIVESSAMSAVSAPVLTYKPNIPQELIDSGKLSDIQIESISYAGQAFEQKLPNGQRKGFFIGDGTGVGKGRQIAGVILDNFNHGGKKALWISQASGLVEDARRDWKGLGGDAGDVLQYDDVKKKKAGLGAYDKGILFTTYNMLGAPTGEKHLKTITDWLGKDFDGVIVFDEAHNMSNIAPIKGARGKNDPAKRAQRGVELQRMLPNARVLYASATGATNVNNLLYAERLGLWGEGTQFVDAQDFVAKISKSGIAAMELVARDMKGMGDYLARSISYDGVEFERLTHNLTQDQLYMYDTMCEAWQVILQNVEKAIGDTKSPKNASSAFWGSLQRFYESIITSFAVPSVIEDMEKELAAGHSCVIQLVNTREAAQNRAVDKLRESGSEDYDDLDLTPRETIEQFLMKSFPVEQFEEYIDADGNTSKRAVVDSAGNPVINKKALAARDELIEKLKDIRIPDSPIDMIINHFGVENVSEITNRKVRFVDKKDENGNVKKVKVERNTDIAKISEAQDFNDGKTRILIFSKAGGTGMSYHADKNFKNQQQRVGYILQAGYNPETAIQGIGRINRSNQTSKPIFKLVQTDISAQKRFFTSIARRIEQMGALTRGQRQAGSGLFSADDNLESDLSQSALEAFYKKLGTGKIPGLNAEEIFSKMGMKKYFYDEYGNFSPNKAYLTDIPKFLNRIMALDVRTGNKAFDAFMEIRDSYYETAREAGTLDTGMENVKADKVEIVNDSTVYTDPSTGAETRYIQAKVYNKPTVIKTLEDAKAYKPNFQGIVRMEDGSVRAVYRIADQTNAMGIVQKRYRLQGASTTTVNTMNERNLGEKTEKIPESEWQDAWKEAVKSVPEYDESELHMITGALLPIWNKLPTEGTTKAMRITASDGTQYLGRIISPKQIDEVLHGLGVKGTSVKKEYSGTDLYSAIMDKAQVAVFNGMYGGTITVARRRVSGENRLEVSGGNLFALKNKYPGVFSETIQYKTRYFIPSGDRGKEILAGMARDYGVRSLGKADDESTVFFSKVQSTWGSRDGKDGKLPKMKSVSDLYKEAKSIFGVEINTGKIGSANAEGIYNTHANTIRTRVYGDLPTIAHELGHMFDKKYNLNEAAEVDKLVEHYRSDLEEAGYNESLFRNEAIAMYFADMLRNSETAQQENPEFSRYLFETLSNEDRNKLGDYKQMTAQYYAADDRTRRGAQIHYRHKDNSAIGKAKFQVDLLSKNPRAYMDILGRQFVHYFIDDVASIGSAVGKENSRNALNLARRQRMADSIAAGRLKYAFTDNNGYVIGQSLQAVLSEGGINDKNARDFDAYLVARVALDRLENNENDKSVKTLVYADKSLGSMSALVDAIEEYERLNPTFHDAAEGVYEYNNNLLRIAVESGIIKEELAEYLKSTLPHYVPLYRVMDRDNPSYSGRGKKTPHSPIARFKGSGRDIYSPIENIIVQTVNFTKAIQQNEARKALFDAVDQNEDMGIWAEKVPESKVFDMVPTTDVSDKIKAFLTNDDLYTENLSDEQLGELYEDIMSYVGQYTGMWKRKQNQGDTVVSVMRNGSPHYYEIHDEVLLEDLEALAPKQRNVVVNAFSVVTRTMSTLTTTVSPRFNLFTNPIRDAVNGFIYSKTTVNPVKYATDLARAFFDAIRESDDFKLYLARGGGYTGSLTSNMNVMRNMHQALVQRTGLHPIAWFSEFVPSIGIAVESATRFSEYRRSLEQGDTPIEAIQKSNEITVDFRQGGSATKYTNNFVMFFNAQITSIIQNFKRLKDKKTLAKWLAVNLLTAASWAVIGNLIYDALGIDKEEADDAYAQMSPYNKFSNELLYIGDGQFIRIPKDTSTMILNTLAKAMWEKEVIGNDNAFREMNGYLVDTFLPFWGAWNDISIFGTAFDLKENKTFTGAPIVPTAYQKQNPEMQYNEKTSAFSIRLGALLGLSPMQIDYVIDDTMGYIGDLFLNLTKQGGPDWKNIVDVQKTSEKSILKGLPVPGVVLRDSVYSTDIVNVFYDTKDKYDKASNGYKAGGEKYTFYDTYGSYKYGKIADLYTKVNRQIKATSDEVMKRDLRAELNAVLNSVNNTEKTKLDERIADLAQKVGCSASDIAPYIVIPEDVKAKNANGENVTYVLSGYNMIDYFNASQVMLPLYCENIMNADATPEEKADALKKLKKEVKKYLDDQFVEYMSGR